MRSTLRRLLAAGAALLAVLAAAPQVAVHSHQAWETELARAVVVRSTAPGPCAPARHFDPAETDVHPPCPACLARCGELAVIALRTTLQGAMGFVARSAPSAPQSAATHCRSHARGRAPPGPILALA